MATRSHIYIEHSSGLYTGTYCHYDGHPEHKVPALLRMHYDDVYSMIVTATAKGGINSLNVTEQKGADWHFNIQYLPTASSEYLTDPHSYDNLYVDYIYIKREDGSVEYHDRLSDPNLDSGWNKVGSLEEYFGEV